MKRRRVEFSPEAEADLRAIYDWIERKADAVIALGYIERLYRACMTLDIASERGTARHDIRKGLRITGFERRATIAFTVSPNTVTILRVFYGGRDWEREFE